MSGDDTGAVPCVPCRNDLMAEYDDQHLERKLLQDQFAVSTSPIIIPPRHRVMSKPQGSRVQRSPIPRQALGSPVWFWNIYGGHLRKTIHAFKYKPADSLSPWLGDRMVDVWSTLPNRPESVLLVPVPIHRERGEKRGFNQAERLAQRLSEKTGDRCLPHGLVRTKATRAQFKLTPQERRDNLANAFAIGPDLKKLEAGDRQTPIVIVDDIYTTGTTAQTLARLLEKNGFTVAGILVLSRALNLNRRSRLTPPSAPH
ncbi:MAG: ComF family protein [Cyanophyceae cyanobacterium]